MVQHVIMLEKAPYKNQILETLHDYKKKVHNNVKIHQHSLNFSSSLI